MTTGGNDKWRALDRAPDPGLREMCHAALKFNRPMPEGVAGTHQLHIDRRSTLDTPVHEGRTFGQSQARPARMGRGKGKPSDMGKFED